MTCLMLMHSNIMEKTEKLQGFKMIEEQPIQYSGRIISEKYKHKKKCETGVQRK